MHHQALSFSFAALAATAPFAFAKDEVVKRFDTTVVTATLTETPLRQVGSSITVITAQDIANRRLNTVADILRGQPGLDVVRNGGLGQTTSVFLRGANSNHTLVLIDGVETNDPSNPGGLFDFAHLQADEIERIEILRGGESSIYGSDAIGGVINIITKKGAGALKLQGSGEGGSYDTFRLQGGVSGGTDRLNYNLSASRLETDGFSAADKEMGNFERDGYKNTTVTGRVHADATDNLDFDWNLRFNKGTADLDNCGGFSEFGTLCDDPNSRSNTEQLFTRGQGRLRLFDNLWEQKLGIAYSLTDRRNINKVDATHPTEWETASFTGEKIKVDWQNNLYLHETNTLTLGIQNEEDRIHADDEGNSLFGPFSSVIQAKTANTTGYYGQDQINLFNRSFTTLGVRFDDHNRFGGEVTWRATQAFVIEEIGTRIKGSYGTGFKAPTLYQLFAPPTSFGPLGNSRLQPEKSRNWDVGIEQGIWDGKLSLGATYFNNDFLNLIDFDFGTGFNNINKAESEGVETFLEFKPTDDLTLRGNYTYTRTQDHGTKLALLRRPRHKGSFDANYRISGNTNVNLNVLLVGERDDMNFDAFERVTMQGYALVNLAGTYDVTDDIQLFARIDNVFDKKYQETFGFGTMGVAGFGGVKMSY
ncbi:TonB-dependent receptor plug domain-containing protein [Methylocaldum sp.]|uniref:TonB-dependent receptor plug domain-containing protein n=1 Tax=Methylocaldum sp. TaxID=1969727 RepID=UPI002D72F8EB|nr:TonB-dependent receptor [Methylocaldum sp.]HYE36115.1 TonB-dependent receptor [Methylocaldum sp.]